MVRPPLGKADHIIDTQAFHSFHLGSWCFFYDLLFYPLKLLTTKDRRSSVTTTNTTATTTSIPNDTGPSTSGSGGNDSSTTTSSSSTVGYERKDFVIGIEFTRQLYQKKDVATTIKTAAEGQYLPYYYHYYPKSSTRRDELIVLSFEYKHSTFLKKSLCGWQDWVSIMWILCWCLGPRKRGRTTRGSRAHPISISFDLCGDKSVRPEPGTHNSFGP